MGRWGTLLGSNDRRHNHLSIGARLLTACLCLAAGRTAVADIAPSQVLVVYNSTSADAVTLKNTYAAAYPDIPAENFLDLNDAALLTSDQTHAAFIANIRNPIRDYLLLPGVPDAADIIAMVLIRPFPHRLLDTDNALVGDSPGSAANELLAGDATYGSIDAELVLIWQNLAAGEAGGTMDSRSDNLIDNPYHQSTTPIDTFSRSAIQTQKSFTNSSNVVWTHSGGGPSRLTPGDMVLVCRIDGATLADAQAIIDRAADLHINKAAVRILLDEYDVTLGDDLDDDPLFSSGDPFLAGDDFEETEALLAADGWDVRYDGTFDFISAAEETMTLIAYSSYGENHTLSGIGENPPGTGTYIDGFTFAPGAIFNTLESFNGRALNGLGTRVGQEQAADFIAAGGTFAVGQVFEPFSFTLADNEFLMVNLLGGQMTWAEAAYTSLPALSWQHIVFGDPLAKPAILDDAGLPQGDLDSNGQVDGNDIAWFDQIILEGLGGYRAAFPALDPIVRADFTGDFQVTLDDTAGFVAALLAP